MPESMWTRTGPFTACFFLAALFVIAYLVMSSVGGRDEASFTACADAGPRKQVCYEKRIEEIAQAYGIAAGFDVLAKIYTRDRDFATFCHGSTHELGKVAYAAFREHEDFTVSAKTSYCGFGFYHGFMEAMIHDTGDVARAKEFCDYVDNGLKGTINGVSYACYHGIGHGTVDGTDTALWGDETAFIAPGLAMCASLPTGVEEHKTRCASGVFNALAIAYMAPKYGFRPNPQDPYRACRSHLQAYERKACYDQMNGYVNQSSADFKEALQKALSTSDPAYRDLALETTAGYRALEAESESKELGAYVEDCDSLPASYRTLCIRGFSSSLIEQGKPGEEYKKALAMCLGAGGLRDVCLTGVYVSVYDRLPPTLRNSLCTEVEAAIGKVEGDRCREVMEGS